MLDSPTSDISFKLNELAESEVISVSEDDVPDGGLQAWLTVLGGFLMYFCGLGYFMTFGVFQDFYVREFMTNKTPSEIAWIGGTQIMMQFILGLPVGKAFDAGYFHHLAIGGSLIYCFSLFMLSLAKPEQYYQVFLAQGVGMGIGLALTFLPATSIIAHHFTRRRGMAIGMATCGASVGGIIFPVMLNKLIARQGFAVGVRASAGLIAGLMLIANLIMRPRYITRTVPGPKTSFLSLMKDTPYVLLLAAGDAMLLGMFYPVFYLQLFAVKHGINEDMAFYTVSFISAGGVVGRIVLSVLADHFGNYNILIPVILCTGVFILALLGVTNVGGVIVVSLLYGAMNGGVISVIPALLAKLSNNVDEVGIRMGLWFTFSSIAALLGQPISGALLTDKFIWANGTTFAGVCLVASSVLVLFSRYLFVRKAGGSQIQLI